MQTYALKQKLQRASQIVADALPEAVVVYSEYKPVIIQALELQPGANRMSDIKATRDMYRHCLEDAEISSDVMAQVVETL